MMTLEQLMLAAVLFLAASVAFTSLSEKLKLGPIFGLLVAGVALGPYSPGPVLTNHSDELLHIGEFGVVLLMFSIGLEMLPRKLWEMRRFIFGLGPLQVLVTGSALTGGLYGVSRLLGGTLEINGAAALGFGFALSSTAIVMQVLADRGDAAKTHGHAVFSVLVLQDIASVALLVIVPLMAVTAAPEEAGAPLIERIGLMVAALGGVVIGGRYIMPPIFEWAARSRPIADLNLIALMAAMAAAVAMDEAGLSMEMGAFLLGVLLSASAFRDQLDAGVSSFKGLALSMFFVAVGMSIDLNLAADAAAEVIGFTLLITVVKVAVMLALGRLFGLGRGGSLRAAFAIAPCSEFGFVLFASANSVGLMTDRVFALAITVIALSMALTPFVAKLGYALAARTEGPPPTAETAVREASEDLRNHVVVAGFGDAGRMICLMLAKTDTPYIAFDLDPRRIRLGRSTGYNVHYGDVSDPAMHGAAAFARARSVVVTLETTVDAVRLVEQLRHFYPNLPIQLAAPNLTMQDEMRAKGVADALCTAVEGRLQLGEAVLARAGVSTTDIESLTASLRKDDYALIREAAPGAPA